MAEQIFYGYFEDAARDAKPEYDPPYDAPCPFCGKAITSDDVRTHSLMYAAPSYAMATNRNGAIPVNLKQRCKEVVAWRKGGTLPASAELRKYAASLSDVPERLRLRIAEDDTAIDAMNFVARNSR